MKEARIICPFDDLGPLGQACHQLIQHLLAAFGGLTQTAGNGFWIPKGETKEYAEMIRILDVAYDGCIEGDNKLFDMANAYRIEAKQQEVYLRYGNGHVQFVKEGSKMENGEFDWAGLMSDLGHDIDDPVVLEQIAS